MSDDCSPSGAAFGLGNDVQSIVRAPKKEYEGDPKREARALIEALSEPERAPDALDKGIDVAATQAADILTPRRVKQREQRLRHEATIQAEAARAVSEDDSDGYSDAEYRELLNELDEPEGEDNDWSSFAWR